MLVPWLLDGFGSRGAFCTRGLGMLIATVIFWLGVKRYVNIPPRVARDGQLHIGPRDEDDQPHLLWQILPFLVQTAGEVMVPVLHLPFAYTQAPLKMKSPVMCT